MRVQGYRCGTLWPRWYSQKDRRAQRGIGCAWGDLSSNTRPLSEDRGEQTADVIVFYFYFSVSPFSSLLPTHQIVITFLARISQSCRTLSLETPPYYSTVLRVTSDYGWGAITVPKATLREYCRLVHLLRPMYTCLVFRCFLNSAAISVRS